MSDELGFDELFVEFAQELRTVGLVIGSDDLLTFCKANSILGPIDIMNIYWAGRTTLVRRQDTIPAYNRKFYQFFLDISEEETNVAKKKFKAMINTAATLEIPQTEESELKSGEEEKKLGFVAAVNEIYRNKNFSECSEKELLALRKMMSALKLSPPVRRTRRLQRVNKAKVLNMRAMVRETMRTHGEPKEIIYSKRKEKLRPIVLILDVSGSMADYSRNLLQMAYSARRANSKVEVFCFGTRLTRITKSLSKRNPDEAMRLAGAEVMDWDGGTRIGDSIATFIKRWGKTRIGRGSIAIICSDGLDRGDPATLAAAMENLSRIAFRVIWMNPHKGDSTEWRPTSLGMMVADPFIDEVVSGHNLKSLEDFSRKLAQIR